MASGYTVSGRGDLDVLLAARVSAARANVGLQVAGTDIAQRYEAIGSANAVPATGFRSGGTDLALLFRGKQSLVAGSPASNPDSHVGYNQSPAWGSLTPSTIKGTPVAWLYDYLQPPGHTVSHFAVALNSGVALTSTYFTTIVINGTTYTTSAASFNASAPFYIWDWIGRANLVAANSYDFYTT